MWAQEDKLPQLKHAANIGKKVSIVILSVLSWELSNCGYRVQYCKNQGKCLICSVVNL